MPRETIEFSYPWSGLSLEELLKELEDRFGISGLDEKSSRDLE